MTSHLKRLGIGIFATIFVAGALIQTLGQEPPKSRPTIEISIADLLQKRRAVLSELVKVQTEAYRKGEAGIVAIVQGHQELLQVELELATDHDARIKLLKESVRLAGDLERIAEANYHAGHASAIDVLKSKAERLRTETDLLRERQRTEKE